LTRRETLRKKDSLWRAGRQLRKQKCLQLSNENSKYRNVRCSKLVNMALPVTAEIHQPFRSHRQPGDAADLFAIGQPPNSSAQAPYRLFATGKTPYREQRPLCMAAQRRVMVAARDPPIGLVREKGRDPWPGSPAAR
jgi:hypothetical protein